MKNIEEKIERVKLLNNTIVKIWEIILKRKETDVTIPEHIPSFLESLEEERQQLTKEIKKCLS